MSSWSSPKSERRAPSDFLKRRGISTTFRRTRDATQRYSRERFIAFLVLAVRLVERQDTAFALAHLRPPRALALLVRARQLVRAHQRAKSRRRLSENRCCFSFALRDDSSDSCFFFRSVRRRIPHASSRAARTRARSAARAIGSTATRTISSANAGLAPVDVARSRSTGGTYLWCFGTGNLGAGDVSTGGYGETKSIQACVASWSRNDGSSPARLVSPTRSSRPMAAAHACRMA